MKCSICDKKAYCAILVDNVFIIGIGCDPKESNCVADIMQKTKDFGIRRLVCALEEVESLKLLSYEIQKEMGMSTII